MGSTPVPPIPNPPVPNPPTDSIPIKPARTLQYALNKEYSIVWGNTAASSRIKSRQLTKSRIKAAGYTTMKITNLKLGYESTTDVVNSEKLLKNAVDWFFTNRGLMMLPGQDEQDVLYYTAHFLKMILLSEKKVKVNVLEIGNNTGLFMTNPLQSKPTVIKN